MEGGWEEWERWDREQGSRQDAGEGREVEGRGPPGPAGTGVGSEDTGPERPLESRRNGSRGGLRGQWSLGGSEGGREKLTGKEGARSIKNLSVHNTKCQGL